MRALAQQMEKEQEYEALLSHNRHFQAPPGATEVSVKIWQVHRHLSWIFCNIINRLFSLLSMDDLVFSLCNCWPVLVKQFAHVFLLFPFCVWGSCWACWRAQNVTWSEQFRGGLTGRWLWWCQSELGMTRPSLQVTNTLFCCARLPEQPHCGEAGAEPEFHSELSVKRHGTLEIESIE